VFRDVPTVKATTVTHMNTAHVNPVSDYINTRTTSFMQPVANQKNRTYDLARHTIKKFVQFHTKCTLVLKCNFHVLGL
jgi:hypothetical protein